MIGEITGIWLKRDETHVTVSIEMRGMWIEVIRESACGPSSHIIEPSGLKRILADELSERDLRNSGGIVDE